RQVQPGTRTLSSCLRPSGAAGRGTESRRPRPLFVPRYAGRTLCGDCRGMGRTAAHHEPPIRSGGTTMQKHYPYYLANKAVQPNTDLEVRNTYTGRVATRVAVPDARAVEKAIRAAVRAEAPMREFKPWQRQAVLNHCVERMAERRKELAEALCIEAGKP